MPCKIHFISIARRVIAAYGKKIGGNNSITRIVIAGYNQNISGNIPSSEIYLSKSNFTELAFANILSICLRRLRPEITFAQFNLGNGITRKITMKKIVGRRNEIARFKHMLSSKEAEFVAVYGRRRIGKTFLIQFL